MSPPPESLLDRLQVQRAGLALAVGPYIVGKPLTDCWDGLILRGKGATLKAEHIATGFRLDLAVPLIGVERADGSKILHGEFLCWHAPEWRSAARRRQRWREVRLSAQNRRLRLVATKQIGVGKQLNKPFCEI